jgi:hypothetical protein
VLATLLMVFATVPYTGPALASHADDLNEAPEADIAVDGTCSDEGGVAHDGSGNVEVEDLNGDGEICIVLDGSGSEDPDADENQITCHPTANRDIQFYHWYKNGSSDGVSDTATENRTDDVGSTITWGLEVEDWCGARSDTAEIDVHYSKNDQPVPKFNVDVEEDFDGDGEGVLSFDAAGSEDDGTIQGYDWAVEDGEGQACAEGSGEAFDASCPAGDWSATLTVTDNANASKTVAVSSTDVEPIPENAAPTDPEISSTECADSEDEPACEGETPVTVEFKGGGTDKYVTHECSWVDADDAPTDCPPSKSSTPGTLECNWDFEDGATTSESCDGTVSHDYDGYDEFTVKLTVTDQVGDTSDKGATTSVEILPPAPNATIVTDGFDGSQETDYFVEGPSAEEDSWSFSGLAHVSAACMDKGELAMYGDQQAALQFNRKTVFEGYVPFVAEESLGPDGQGQYVDPAVMPLMIPQGPRCTYDDEHGDAQGKAILKIGPEKFETPAATWANATIAFDQWGELEGTEDVDLDTVGVEARSAQADDWETLGSWNSLPNETNAESRSFEVNRPELGNITDGLDVRFFFEADNDFNDNRGWFVDNLSVTGSDLCPTAQVSTPKFIDIDEGKTSKTVTLDGAASHDREGSIEAYQWESRDDDWTDEGLTADRDLERGEHNFTLEVTDEAGCTDAVDFSVIVNQFPTAVASVDDARKADHDGDEDVTFQLDGTNSSDPEDGDVDCVWTDSSGNEIGEECLTSHSLNPDDVSEETFTLTVSDTLDATSSTSLTVDVRENPQPTAATGDDRTVRDSDISGDVGVTLDGTDSEDVGEGEIVAYEWTNDTDAVVGDNATVDLSLESSAEMYNFTLKVTDNGDATGTDNVTITVEQNELPKMDPAHECDRMTCEFSANAEDDTGIQECTWQFPEGEKTGCGDDTPIEWTFPEPDDHNVTLSVTDDDGETNETTFTVETEGLFVDSFEDGALGAWSLQDTGDGTNLWRVGDDCETPNDDREGDYAAQFNLADDCNYDDGHVQGAIERTVDLTDRSESASANLTFHQFFGVEGCDTQTYDEMTVSVVAADGTAEELAVWNCQDAGSNGWELVDLSLDEYTGQERSLRFSFDSSDSYDNEETGWLIDRISVW